MFRRSTLRVGLTTSATVELFMGKQSRLPSGRAHRLFKLGKIAGGVATSVLGNQLERRWRGEKTTPLESLLTPANMSRVAEQLSQMRGAAMKLGQLMSMEGGNILPRELSALLASLRNSAHSMTSDELHSVLIEELGTDWRDQFAIFNEHPLAAASIGQVHHAVDLSGQQIALKVQYPGVADSIDSDIDNAVSLVRLGQILPSAVDLEQLVAIAKAQLHSEADYLLEAKRLKSYARRIADEQGLHVPDVFSQLTTQRILAMTYLPGSSVDSFADSADDALRNWLIERLISLTVKELFVWGQVQSDPNFANFLYDTEKHSIGLVDFGAVIRLSAEQMAHLKTLLLALVREDITAINDPAFALGYIQAEDPFNYRMAVIDLLKTAAEPAQTQGPYAFASSDLPQRMAEKLYLLRKRDDYQRIPPAQMLFLHRKLAGMFMLASRLRARVDVHAIIQQTLHDA